MKRLGLIQNIIIKGVYYTYKHHVHMYMYDYMYVHVYTIQCIVYNYTQYLYQNLDSIFLI